MSDDDLNALFLLVSWDCTSNGADDLNQFNTLCVLEFAGRRLNDRLFRVLYYDTHDKIRSPWSTGALLKRVNAQRNKYD